MTLGLVVLLAIAAGSPQPTRASVPVEQRFALKAPGEAVATITASCRKCNWGVAGSEAVALRVLVNGRYSQHVLLVRGATPAPYRIMLGTLPAGQHRLRLERDTALSAAAAGPAKIERVDVATFVEGSAEHASISQAPFLYARPGTVERFSDVPLLMWVEHAPAPARGFRYSVIFSHEDGGTPTDRLMATWGRTTDIEFIFGIEDAGDGVLRQEFQGRDHEILPFRGTREGSHPLLWVSTDNNMVSDNGPAGIRFAPAPELVVLTDVSREAVMDQRAWTYAVMAAELQREGRIDAGAQPGSAKVPDPRHFAYLEACGEVDRATLAFDVAVKRADGAVEWHASDRGDARFRIARGGCFRAAVPVPPGTRPADLHSVRVRAYTRPPRGDEPALRAGTGRVTLRRVNTVFMLDEAHRRKPSSLKWTGVIEIRGESPPAVVPIAGASARTP